MNQNRNTPGRVPSRLERIMVRGRMQGVRPLTFARAWSEYLEEEQELMDKIIESETRSLAGDKHAFYDMDDVLMALDRIQEVLECTAMKAMRVYLNDRAATDTDKRIDRERQTAEARRFVPEEEAA